MIIPLSHEHTTVRRLPWVTFTIIILCVLAFIATRYGSGDIEQRLGGHFEKAFEYYLEHPYLELDKRLQDIFLIGVRDDQTEALIEVMRESGPKPPASVVLVDQYQAELNRLTTSLFDALYDLPWYKWGLVPARKTLYGFITYQFMHGGWLHLLGNMFFLYLAGPFIEDVWGRPIFASFYLVGGAISALLYALRYPDFDGPLIGASASVAAVMGAFLIRWGRTNIKFFYFLFVFIGTFTAPAWLMLPLWLAREFFFAQAMDTVGATGGGGVAHWAHVWGFAFGAIVAGGLSYFKVEDRFLHKAIEEKITLFDNSALEEAIDAYREGRHEEAIAKVAKEVAENPENVDAVITYWNYALQLSQASSAAPAMLKAVQRAVRLGEIEVLDPQFLELARSAPEVVFDPATALKLAEYLADGERIGAMEEMLEAAERGLTAATPPGVLLRLARLAAAQRSPMAAELVDRALSHPEIPQDAQEELDELAMRFPMPDAEIEEAPEPVQPPDAEEETGPAQRPVVDEPADSAPHSIQVMEAVPTGLSGATLSLAVKGSVRKLGLVQVQAIAVVGVAPPGGRSFILIDLFLDSPLSNRPKLRAIRVRSTSFDPRKVVGGSEVMPAFREFLKQALQLSGAVGLPDEAAARGGSLNKYSSIDDYQREVLGVIG